MLVSDPLQLHVPDHELQEMQARKEVQEKLKAARAKGIVFLVLHHIISQFLAMLRRTHPWISVVLTPLDLQLSVSRPQRVASLCAVMLTSMAVNAMFFGKSALTRVASNVLPVNLRSSAVPWSVRVPDPDNVGDRVVAGLISALIITPVNMFFPFMFKRVNTFRSSTVSRIEALRKLQLAKRRRDKLYKGAGGACKCSWRWEFDLN